MMEFSYDFISDIIDEISLEGLEGITLQGLWLRLSKRPRFMYKPNDDHIKRFLWKNTAKISCIDFYNLPSKREVLIAFNRSDYVDACGNFYEPDDMAPCIYPHFPIDVNGVMGSSSTYSKRENVSKVVRNEDFDTVQRRGNSLILVADQNARGRALCGMDFNPVTELGLIPYCILERIGRSRYEGEVTQGKRGLQMVTEDPKMLYYFRKLLVKHKLVLKQVFYMRVAKQTSTGSLLHLTRFYAELKTRQDADAIKLINYLENSPMKYMPLKAVRSQLNVEVKKLLMKYPKNFKTALVPYRVMNPSSKPNDWKLKSTGEERNVRVMKLINSSISKDEEEEDDDEEEVGILDASQRRMDRTLMRQAYYLIEQSGPRGIKQTSLGSLLAVPSLQARSICKHLVKRKLVNTSLIDVGRQRITQFYCAKFDSSERSLISEIQEEKNRLLQAISLNSTMCDTSHLNEPNTSMANEADSTFINDANCSQDISKQPETDTEFPENFNSEEDITAEIIISKPETLGENFKGLAEGLKNLDENSYNSVTAKMLKRASIIVQSVNLHKVIQDTQKVQRIISEEEESEGLKQTIDRKTIQRLLDKLESDGLLKTIRVNLKGYGREKSMLFICHPSVNESHSEIQSAIEQAKMKLPIISAHHTKKNLKKISQKPKLPTLKYDMKEGRRYGYKPKFVRMRKLHSYMYYLIYGYDGDPNLDQSCKEEIISKLSLDSSFLEEMPFVYRNEVDWKMFLPPLPIHTEYTTGWCLLSDVLLRLPLCLFVNIVNVPYSIPGLMDYINHPVKRYFLVKELPTEILNYLTLMRKYIFVVSDIVARLGFIGLIQMGPQKLKEKDQVFIYLNKHAILYNTTPSEVGYNHISKDKNYECIKYEFMSLDDVVQYWCDLWNFAMHTNLGNRNSMTGQNVVVESVHTKKELLTAIQTKTAEEAKLCDIGYIPGDNLGAGGLDSDMFVHLKRNWYWTGKKVEDAGDQSTLLYPPVIKQHSKGIGHKRINKHTVSRPIEVTKEKDKDGSVPSKNQKPDPTKIKGSRQALISGWKSRAVSKKKTRILKQRKTKFPRKPYYDQKDKDALSRMVKLRVDWSSTEDNLLLICKVASLYMSPYKRRQVAKNFCAVREILHTTYPTISRNKTSRACQRRMHYMMKKPFTAQSVYMCLEEIKQDPEIHSKFHRAVEKLDALLKAQGEGPKGYQEEYDKIFMNLVSTLLKRLKTITNPEKTFFEVKLPDTVAEFMKHYNPFTPKPHNSKNLTFFEVNKVVDIMASVINTVIHSSLCCTAEKTSYSNQLFYIYQQYPDKLLRHVMARCRSMQIISCSKQYKRWKSMGFDCLPLASSPYQLSITYVHILQSKYQYYIFSECYNGLKSILGKGDESCKQSQNFLKENKEKTNQKALVNIEVSTGGQCANVVELFTSGLIEMHVEFPDQLIVLDPRLSETEERYKLIMKRFREMLNIIKESRKKENKTLMSEDEDDEEDIGDDNAQSDDKEPYFEQFNLKNKTGVANTASRLALYLMRDEPLEQLDQNIQHAHDFFVLNPCKVTVELDQRKAEEFIFYKNLKTKVLAEIKKFATFPEEKSDNDQIIPFLEMKQSLVLPVLEFLESKCELGATYDDLKALFDEDQIKEVLINLVENQFILKTGLITPRFIHNKYSKPWLVKSFYLQRQTRESLGPENTNSAYAISIGDSELTEKRKQKWMANSSKQSVNSDGLPKKRIKLDISFDESNTINSGASTSAQSSSKDDVIDIPPNKKLKTNSGTLSLEQGSNDTSLETTDNRTVTENQENNLSDLAPSTSQEKAVENEHHSRFLVKSTNRRWIAVPNENMKKFSNFNPSDSNVMYVRVRPWIKIDGTLNRRVLDRLLGSVLGHCLSCPGISVTRLQERFTPALQPAHTYELVEILQKIKCVQLMELKKGWKATLFSKRVPISPGPADGLGSTTNIIVEAEPFAVSRLGYFIGDKSYTIDYLTQLSYANKDGLIS